MNKSDKNSGFEDEFDEGDNIEIISSPIILMRTAGLCSSCRKDSIVYGINGYWRDLYISLIDIEKIPDAVNKVIPSKVKENYFFNDSEGCFVNHCIHCKNVILDRDLFHGGDAFGPLSYNDVDLIEFYQLPVDGDFEFVTQHSCDEILQGEMYSRSVSLAKFH